MVDIGYWLDTFLSRPDEVATLLLTLGAFGVAAARYDDRRDTRAVLSGTGLLAVVLALAGPMVVGEWHYWAGGGLLAAAAILLVDGRRR